MNDDQITERALKRLRDAEPAAGFEQRLLVSLRNAAEPSSRPYRLTWLVSFALLLLVATSFLLLARQPRPKGPEPTASVRHAASPAIPAQPVQQPRGHRARRRSARSLASNTPAPPVPLTEQEKLLQRVVQRRDTGNVALLNPAAQHTENARATQQFQHFFAMTSEEVRNQFE